jgi:hypothetical protein
LSCVLLANISLAMVIVMFFLLFFLWWSSSSSPSSFVHVFIKVYIYGQFKEPLNISDISHWLSIGNKMLNENTIQGGQGYCDIVLFSMGTMFELLWKILTIFFAYNDGSEPKEIKCQKNNNSFI